ncbi:hypothetical protein GLYMA_12G140250v4 [Glycine max]|nr:hypothetical protein GLYMA_12G140250v4 [Glycine max]KAH1143094.1 hypothetical protein GYH30_033685 [Glycine max]
MMAEQRNGMNLSGQNRPFMSVFTNKPNGQDKSSPTELDKVHI